MKNKILLSVKYNENKPNDPYAQKNWEENINAIENYQN